MRWHRIEVVHALCEGIAQVCYTDLSDYRQRGSSSGTHQDI